MSKCYVLLGGNRKTRLKKIIEILKKEEEYFEIITTGSGWLYKYQKVPEGLVNLKYILEYLKRENKIKLLKNFYFLPSQDTISEVSLISNFFSNRYIYLITDYYHKDRVEFIFNRIKFENITIITTNEKGSLYTKIKENFVKKVLESDFNFFEINNPKKLMIYSFSLPYNNKLSYLYREYFDYLGFPKNFYPLNLDLSLYKALVDSLDENKPIITLEKYLRKYFNIELRRTLNEISNLFDNNFTRF